MPRWYTTEEPPRRLEVKGRSAIDPDVMVATDPDNPEGRALWVLENGYKHAGPFTVIGDGGQRAYKAMRLPDVDA